MAGAIWGRGYREWERGEGKGDGEEESLSYGNAEEMSGLCLKMPGMLFSA